MGKGKDVSSCFMMSCGIVSAVGLFATGITKIVIGAIYLHDCSIQSKVPVYLIVSALAPLLFGGAATPDGEGIVLIVCGIIGGLFNLSWVICGSVWVYPTFATVHKDTYVPCNSVNGTYTPPGCTEGMCNDTLLNFAFAMVTLDWVTIVIYICILGVMACQ